MDEPHRDFFPASYAEARIGFSARVRQLGWHHQSLAIDAQGPSGESLAVDVGFSKGRPGDNALVLSSGLHGVEGFFGSAVQLCLLARWSAVPPPQGVRIVMLHALNPYGYAAIRRCDEQNRDLNRNFLLAGDRYSGCPTLYPQLDSFLNPRRAPRAWEPFVLPALMLLARHGFSKLQSTIASGQYEFPKGLFYGGNCPSQLSDLLSKHLPSWLEGCRRAMHFDFHSGLGKSANCSLLLDSPLQDVQRRNLETWLGPDSYCEPSPHSGMYQATGSLGRWCRAHSGIEDYLYACAEFGTYGPLQVLRALRVENQCHHWGTSHSASTIESKRRLKEAFCPSSPRWRHAVLARANKLIDQSMNGLASTPI